MRKLVIVFCVLLLAGGAYAREATITPAGDLNIVKHGGAPMLMSAQQDCTLGNVDFDGLQGHYSSWWLGFEDYAYLVNPAIDGCACSEGFVISAVHMLLALDTDTDIQVQGALYTAVPDGFGCLIPGVELYAGPVMNVTGVTELNYYDVAAPITDATYACVPGNADYFLVFRFLDDGAASVGLAVDSTPSGCVNYNNWGEGWEELVDNYGFAGDLYIWGDAECCVNAVPSETSSWGDLKSLFR